MITPKQIKKHIESLAPLDFFIFPVLFVLLYPTPVVLAGVAVLIVTENIIFPILTIFLMIPTILFVNKKLCVNEIFEFE